MKKAFEADYVDDKVIDLRQLDHVRFDARYEAFHVDWNNTMVALYKRTKAQSVGCVSGRHCLVPLTGLRNQAAIFICADNLSPHGYDVISRRGCTVLSFDGYEHQTIRVLVNVSIDTIKRNLDAAAEVSHAQVELLEMVRKTTRASATARSIPISTIWTRCTELSARFAAWFWKMRWMLHFASATVDRLTRSSSSVCKRC